jgi:hypothetical protein
MSQVTTFKCSIESIMGTREFAAGIHDVRHGSPPRFDVFCDDDWGYERGRLFAYIAPLSMQIRINGRLNRKAIALYRVAMERGYIP